MKYTCYSGGASGSDFIWETESIKKGFKVVAYSFENHNTKSKNRFNLTQDQLNEGFKHIKIANKQLNRNLSNLEPYVKNLIARDWFQVESSDAIFAVGQIQGESVMGGTGCDNKKPIYVFDQNYNSWFYYDYDENRFEIYEDIPKLIPKFAGIGTRMINNDGIRAIMNLFTNV